VRRKHRLPESSPPRGIAPTTPPSTPLSSLPALFPLSSYLATPSFLPRDPSRRPTSTLHESSRPWHVPCSRPPQCLGKYSLSRPSYTRQSRGKAAALLVSPNDKRYTTNITAQFPTKLLAPPTSYMMKEIRLLMY
jgi:hypothetical protein